MTDQTAELRAKARQLAEELSDTIAQLAAPSNNEDRFEELEQELQERPLCVDRIVTYRVTIGTGGPACGVDFNEDGAASAWWQDWYTERVYSDMDSDTAETLGDIWGVTAMRDEDEYRAEHGR